MVPRLTVQGGEHIPALPPKTGRGVQLWNDDAGTTEAYGYRDDPWFVMHWPGVAVFRFASANEVHALVSPDAPDSLVRQAFDRTVIPMALQALGREVLHASGVVSSRGVVAFAAHAHTGKSTIAFGLALRGFRQWADDAVVFDLDGGTSRALPLPFAARLRPPSSRLFGAASVSDHAEPNGRDVRVAALCVLRRTTAGPLFHVARLPGSEAFFSVLDHAYCFEPSDLDVQRRVASAYVRLVGSVPVYDVAFRTSVDEVPLLLDHLVPTIPELHA